MVEEMLNSTEKPERLTVSLIGNKCICYNKN